MRSRDGGTTPSPASATRRTYTGQYDIGFWAGAIQHYNARQYDYVLGLFLQPDTIVPDPGNPQTLNRYSYAYNNPINHTDPSGHCVDGFVLTGPALLLIAAVALVVVVVWVSYEVTIGPRAADYRSDFSRLGRDIENLVSPPAQVSTLRGLSPGEQKQLGRIEEFVGHWIPDHPDLVGDVSAVLNGLSQSGGGNFDHVREARERAGMLNRSLELLQKALDLGKLDDESRQAVEQGL